MENQENKSFIDKTNERIKRSVTVKLLSIGVIILLLLIPAFMVQDLIRERQEINDSATNEVGSKWGGYQTITGPIISIPYSSVVRNENNLLVPTTLYAHFLPEELNISANSTTEKRKRGIYEIIVFNGKINLKGNFLKPNPVELGIDEKSILWKEAFVQIGISDMKGINHKISMDINGKEHLFNPGINTNDITESGVSAEIFVTDSVPSFNFEVELDINGSKQLYFIPLGKESNVSLTSTWNSPSFDGNFLPDTREVNEDGFSAEWKILHLNRNFPQEWKENKYNVYESSFGVNFMVMVDHYQKSMRTAKYAILILILTFMGFFFVEIINKQRIHPFQYILIGLAICIFYALLLAFSEHIGFDAAYILSSALTIGAVSYYSKSIFVNNIQVFLLSLILLLLYGFIYIIIQLEDYALLVGSIGLFFVLLTIMHISRKINWYND